jgi:hypothetical protein
VPPFHLIWRFVRSVGSHWGALKTGGIVWAVLLVYTFSTKHDVPPFGFWGVTALAIVAAVFLAWKDQWDERERLALRVVELEKRLRPKLKFVLVENCCRYAATMLIGVGNEGTKSVRNASVYVDIPSLGITNRVLRWLGPSHPETLDIHPGGHHHTDHFASVGDVGEKFYLQFGYGNFEATPVTYMVDLCVKGEDAPAATAKLEVVFSNPRTYSARLL